jgi:hypothetical protein
VVDVLREEEADARERQQRSMLVVVNLEERVPREHPLRRIKQMAERALKDLSPLFGEICSVLGRPSIPPERLLKSIAADGALHDSQRADVL